MPELPEVEVIKLGLEKKIIGLKIQKIQILSPKSFIGNPDLASEQKVLKIWRRAKILGVDLGNNTLLFHMKMSGQLIYVPSEQRKANSEKRFIGGHPTEDMLGAMPNPHTRVIFTFSNGSHLYFNDQRKFGWIKIANNQQLTANNLLQKLGPEPLEQDFTWQILKQNLLKHKKMPVKVAIMDQSVVSGVGNIYSNEACFDAKIDPRRKVETLSDEEFKRLFSGIRKSLKLAIEKGGSTRAHFVDPDGRRGYFLDYAFVYGKDSHPCKVCGAEIKKVQLGGRGTYFCPHDQK